MAGFKRKGGSFSSSFGSRSRFPIYPFFLVSFPVVQTRKKLCRLVSKVSKQSKCDELVESTYAYLSNEPHRIQSIQEFAFHLCRLPFKGHWVSDRGPIRSFQVLPQESF